MYINNNVNLLKNFHRLGSLYAAINAYSLSIAEDPSFLEAYIGRGNVHLDFLTEQGITNSKYIIINNEPPRGRPGPYVHICMGQELIQV